MTSNIRTLHARDSRTFWIAFAVSSLLMAMVAGAALVIAPTAVMAARQPAPTARPVSWALADIAKPTYTPSPEPTFTPTVLPTETLVPTATESPLSTESPLEMSIVSASDQGASAPQTGPDVSSGGKYILVSISEQHLYAYENGQLVYSFIASTGMGNSTRVGTFSVLDKIPNAYGATWNIWMPDWMGIYYSGTLENGIHALPILPSGARLWSGFLGTPISFGCVVLGTDEALQLYNWADVGTPVEIRW